MRRRNFLEAISGAIAGTALFDGVALENIQAATNRTALLSPQEAARDESLWREVQNAFSINRNIVNLDNGNISPSPRNVTEAMIHYTWQQQDAPGHMVWEVLFPQNCLRRGRLWRAVSDAARMKLRLFAMRPKLFKSFCSEFLCVRAMKY